VTDVTERLAALPPPPPGKMGWPWVAEAQSALQATRGSDADWPRMTVVIPCLNHVHYVEETLRSILLQGYPDLELIIIDGGSTDGTLEIIRKYEPWIKYWVSEPDDGLYDAVNKGFAQATGEILTMSNTDDLFAPGAYFTAVSVFRDLPEVEWLTGLRKITWDAAGNKIADYRVGGFERRALMRGLHLAWPDGGGLYMLRQQSTFWRRGLWEKAGGRVDETIRLAGDFDLWVRFCRHAEVYCIEAPLGIVREQEQQLSALHPEAYLEEALSALRRGGGSPLSPVERWLRKNVFGRVPRTFRRLLPRAQYSANVVQWDEAKTSWNVTRKRYG
jgi:glycosyltransferase involved in cell wall biosynthesis